MAMMRCCDNSETCLARSRGANVESSIPIIESMLIDNLKALHPSCSIDAEESARISRLIFDSMVTKGRVYHDMQHVFDISQGMRHPILVLSALFHDVIYHSIDKKFSEEQAKHLEDAIDPNSQQLTLATEFADPLMDMIVRLYGFPPGEDLPKLGTNEFLSGIIGVRVLSKWLDTPQLMAIATCIEATIPFRPIVDGKSPMDRLYDRLKSVCPDQSEEWLVETVRMAAATANFDLCSFDSTDIDFFLDSSWKLIPEARPALLNENCPLLEWTDEMLALEKRTMFLNGAVPKIFQTYGQDPDEPSMTEKQRKTHENLDTMFEYAKVRQLQAMVLVGVVEVMGEDPGALSARSCLTMDVPGLSTTPEDSLTPVERQVRSWLVTGRRACFSWDPARCPLGAYLFDTLGTKGVTEAVQIGKNQKPGSHELLKYLPTSVVVTVASRLGSVFTDRAERFLEVPEKLGILAR